MPETGGLRELAIDTLLAAACMAFLGVAAVPGRGVAATSPALLSRLSDCLLSEDAPHASLVPRGVAAGALLVRGTSGLRPVAGAVAGAVLGRCTTRGVEAATGRPAAEGFAACCCLVRCAFCIAEGTALEIESAASAARLTACRAASAAWFASSMLPLRDRPPWSSSSTALVDTSPVRSLRCLTSARALTSSASTSAILPAPSCTIACIPRTSDSSASTCCPRCRASSLNRAASASACSALRVAASTAPLPPAELAFFLAGPISTVFTRAAKFNVLMVSPWLASSGLTCANMRVLLFPPRLS